MVEKKGFAWDFILLIFYLFLFDGIVRGPQIHLNTLLKFMGSWYWMWKRNLLPFLRGELYEWIFIWCFHFSLATNLHKFWWCENSIENLFCEFVELLSIQLFWLWQGVKWMSFLGSKFFFKIPAIIKCFFRLL